MSNDTIHKLEAARHTLRNVAAAMEQLMRQASGTTDLTLSHALVLVSLTRMPTCKQVDLKSLPGIASPHLTRLLDELTDRGLVCRGRSSEDRRQVLLSLTAFCPKMRAASWEAHKRLPDDARWLIG